MRKNNLGEDLDSAFSSINKIRSSKKLYLISVGQDVIFGFKVPQVKHHQQQSDQYSNVVFSSRNYYQVYHGWNTLIQTVLTRR